MRLAILCFAAAVLAVARLPSLAPWAAIAAGFTAALALALLGARTEGATRAAAVALAAALAGFAWASAYGQLRVADRLPAALEGRDLVVTGVIASLPQPFERGVRFDLDVEAARLADGAAVRVPSRISLSWFNGYTREDFQAVQPVRAGERWRLAVRLKRPHGNANPFGFDFEGWLTERGIGATGYVRGRRTSSSAPARTSAGASSRPFRRAATPACSWRSRSATSARSSRRTGTCSRARASAT
ncbi:MAG: DUF4131 domain-containing protein [Burkholderiales bacterium]|nr:DUF4131 domain-containing protein [Burkholderiales bacterium]